MRLAVQIVRLVNTAMKRGSLHLLNYVLLGTTVLLGQQCQSLLTAPKEEHVQRGIIVLQELPRKHSVLAERINLELVLQLVNNVLKGTSVLKAQSSLLHVLLSIIAQLE